ncbi:TPA: autotransporter outer membrane beta-barrel domain-containing protein [Citrobacter amalonaticus]
MTLLSAFYRHKRHFQITALALAISGALVSSQVHAVVTTYVRASDGQEVTLTPNEQYIMNDTAALIAAESGTIRGEGVSLTVNDGAATITAHSGGKIFLTGATINYVRSQPSFSVDRTQAIQVTGLNSLVDISDSRIESFNYIVKVLEGATARFHNTVMIANLHGLNAKDIGSSIHVTDSDITFLGQSTGFNARNGALVTARNTYIHGDVSYGSALSWDSNFQVPNQTLASKGIYDNVTIETQRNENVGYAIWQIGRSHFLMNDSHIITHGSNTSAVFADKSQEISEVRNTKMETLGNNAIAVSMRNGSQILFADNSEIITSGDNSYALYAHHNNSDNVAPTTITASDTAITLYGTGSYGVNAESAGSQVYLDNVQLTTHGNTSTGLQAKTAGSILHANRLNAQIHGDTSVGVRVQNGADVQLNNSLLNMTGNGSHGIVFNTASTSDANSLQVTGSHIETNDGYAIQNESGSLALNLNDSTIIGRSGGETDVAINVKDLSSSRRSGAVDITADNSHIYGDIISQSMNANRSLDVTLNHASTFTGRTPDVDTMTLNDTSQWNVTDSSTVATLSNNGSVVFSSPGNSGAFKTLTVNGNYSGGGNVTINTTLGDDDSETDKLVVQGNTSGTTGLFVNNHNGGGAQTTDGIEIITVAGESEGIFTLRNRVVAGAYEYHAAKTGKNWYLTSSVYEEPEEPEEPVTPTDPETPVTSPDPAAPATPSEPAIPESPNQPAEESGGGGVKVIRPEAGAYVANLAQANTMFVSRLHDRLGETQYTDFLTGEKKVTSMWLRQDGGHTRSKTQSGQLKTQSNRYVVQIGGDIAQWSHSGLDRFHLGVMAGYGYAQGNTNAKYSAYKAKNRVDGYSLGMYGTWYANQQDKSGFYVDSWVQHAWFTNSVQGDGLSKEKYDSQGWLASVEAGYSFNLSQHDNVSYWIQPKAQVVWMGVHADKHDETNGTKVTGNSGNLSTRLGLRAYRQEQRTDAGTTRALQPFVEVNWLHNTKNVGVTMNDVSDYQAGARNIGEAKVGIEGNINKKLSVWGSVAQQIGDHGYRDSQASIGIKYSF